MASGLKMHGRHGKSIASGGGPRPTNMGRNLSRDATNVVKSHGTANIHSEVTPGATAQSRNKSYTTKGPSRSG